MGPGVAATRGHDDVGGADGLVGPGLGDSLEKSMLRSAMAAMAAGVDGDAGFATSGPGDGAVTGEVREEAHRHLGAAGVVHSPDSVVGSPFDPVQAESATRPTCSTTCGMTARSSLLDQTPQAWQPAVRRVIVGLWESNALT
jgi:hypothetical protein